jgi:hypothetical protein
MEVVVVNCHQVLSLFVMEGIHVHEEALKPVILAQCVEKVLDGPLVGDLDGPDEQLLVTEDVPVLV